MYLCGLHWSCWPFYLFLASNWIKLSCPKSSHDSLFTTEQWHLWQFFFFLHFGILTHYYSQFEFLHYFDHYFGITFFYLHSCFLAMRKFTRQSPSITPQKGPNSFLLQQLRASLNCMTLSHVIENPLGSWQASLSHMFHGTIDSIIVKMWNGSFFNQNSGMCEGVGVIEKPKPHVWRTLAM